MIQRPEDQDGSIRREGIANDFLAAWLRDLERGERRTLESYQAMFPGHEAEVAAEFDRLHSDDPHPPTVAEGPPEVPDVRIEGVLGRGGQGVVYQGRQTYLDRPVAVKVLAPSARGTEFVKRFEREARTLAGLRHANIVTCHQAGVTPAGECYLVMELVEGPNLGVWLVEHGALPPETVLGLGRDLAAALDRAQRAGIVHRDVKPENVLLEPDPQAADERFPWRAKLADLGLARPMSAARSDTALTAAGTVLGTPSTMAPEQFDAPETVDHRADVYGLGCVLYHALCARPAFPPGSLTDTMARKTARFGPDARKVESRVPESVAHLVSRMMARDPGERPQDHAEVMRRCEELLAAGRGGRMRLVAWLGVAVVMAGILLSALEPWAMPPAPPELKDVAVRGVREGETAELEAHATHPQQEQIAYSWKQTAGPPVEIRNPETRVLSFPVPFGSANARLEFEVTATAGGASVTHSEVIPVAASATVREELEGGERLSLFPSTGDHLAGWRGEELEDWSADPLRKPGDPPGVVGHCKKGGTVATYVLPRGSWQLRGAIEPRPTWYSMARPEEPFGSAGLRVEFPGGRGLVLEMRPEQVDGTRYSCTLMEARREEGGWRESEPIDSCSAPWGPGAPMAFRITCREGAMLVTWGGLEQEWNPAEPWPPGVLSLYVREGKACFRDFELEGLR